MKLHWKPLGKQWNGWCSISLKTNRKTMKWMPHRCCSISLKTLRKTMKWEPHGYVSISLKTLRNTMKWDEMGCIEVPNFIPSIHHYIYEMSNEIGNVMNNEMTISLKVLGKQYRSRHPFVGTDCTVFKVMISQK